LGWDDRLVGTLRVALQQNVVPRRYALGTAAALAALDPSYLETDVAARTLLAPLWGSETTETKEAQDVLTLIGDAEHWLKKWRDSGFKSVLY